MAHYENNALLLKAEGTAKLITIKKSDDIKAWIKAQWFEMVLFHRYPITILVNGDSGKPMFDKFLTDTVDRGCAIPPRGEDEEYDFHRVNMFSKIQIFIDDMGALNGSRPNPYFSGQLCGDVVVLGQCIDELAYEPQ